MNFGEGKVPGGNLVVSVKIGELVIKCNVKFKGQNPAVEDLHAFIDTFENSAGLKKVLAHESFNKQFINLNGEPIVSFDQSYGMAQMTNPAPDYTTTWSWKEYVKAGRDLFQTKCEQAINHFRQHEAYTDEMVEWEAIALWNGGYYYKWDETTSSWVCKYNHLCDSTSGNIGWNMNNPTNSGQNEEQLHNQDQPTYGIGSRGQSAQHAWVYSGLCYADKVYGNKYKIYIQLLAFLLGAALNASASEIKETFNRQQPLTIEGVTITPQRELSSLYSDEKLHTVGNRQYFLLINGFPSRPGNPTAQCGVGQEMYADIYQVEDKKATRVQRIMAVSCWHSLELDSWQKQGDFSSITWNKNGVIFDWIVPPEFTNLRAQLNLDNVSPELIFIP
ncbi:hypothetical protein ACI00O_001426 [Cronobacter sakazakii]|uniref:hypothetical protein n=1 Tax=Cronobacter sakazakii TaxID=28141 RepID=UPI001319E741|nr:hypothetical protein [Cronobacter sakazakii]EKK5244494.1 hypothetical protein [Cronobacter sakazakii]ELY4529424.1 hypothetical protein [Cronobacter sakazakii]ELY6088064.1 hypothetical protein [Cronobacter sakazakii]